MNKKCKKCEKKIKPGEKIRLSRVFEGEYWFHDGRVEHIECAAQHRVQPTPLSLSSAEVLGDNSRRG